MQKWLEFRHSSNWFSKPGRWLLLCFLALLPASLHAESLRVLLAFSDTSPPYQQFLFAFNKALAASKADVNVIASQADNGTNADLVVAVGMKAAESAFTRSDTPALGVMIPKAGYEALLKKLPPQQRLRATSAIYIDQPWERQLDFILAALPKHPRIGLLYSPDTPINITSLSHSAKSRGLHLRAHPVQSGETLFDSLEAVLSESDVLLAVPDSTIYNSSNVRNILLTSYRRKVALIGISQAYVNAGALGAIYATPEQQAEQAVEAIVSFAKNRRLPDPQYPDSYHVGLNQQVARSLGIVLDTPEVIRGRMDKVEEGKR